MTRAERQARIDEHDGTAGELRARLETIPMSQQPERVTEVAAIATLHATLANGLRLDAIVDELSAMRGAGGP